MSDLIFIDSSMGSMCENSLRKQARECGFKTSLVLEKGITICVCNRVQSASASLAKASRRTKKMISGNLEQASTASIAIGLGAQVMTFEQFSMFLDQHRVKSSTIKEASAPILSSLTNTQRNGTTSLLRRNNNGVSSWSQSKPLSVSEVWRVSVRDLDGLVPQTSRTINPSKLELCSRGALSKGVNLHLPPNRPHKRKEQWKENSKPKSECEPGASDRGMEKCEADHKKSLKVPVESTGGFCECCNVSFQSLVSHCQSKVHQAFLADDSNFSLLDAFTARLRSGISIPSLPPPPPSETIIYETPVLIENNNVKEKDEEDEGGGKEKEECCKREKRGWLPPATQTKRQTLNLLHTRVKQTVCYENIAPIDTTSHWCEYEQAREQGMEEGRQMGKRFFKLRGGMEVACKVEGWNQGPHGNSVYSVVYADGDMEEMSSEEITASSAIKPITAPGGSSIVFQSAKSVLNRGK